MVGVLSSAAPAPDAAPATAAPAEHGRSFLGMAPPELEMRRRSSAHLKSMAETALKEPPLYHLKFGAVWSQDAIAFHHNAMRRELQDMYYLVSSMHRRVADLTHEDIDDFYDWFDLFEVFCKDFFRLEEEVLIPWLKTKVPESDMLFMAGARSARKAQILSGMTEIDDCQSRFASLPAGEVLPILVRALDRFAPAMISYMSEREKDTIPLISRSFTSAHKAIYDRKLLAWVKESPNAFHLWHLLIRPVPKSSGEHAALRRRFINYDSGIRARMRMKKQYRESQKSVREEHYGIVLQFYRRWGKAAEDAINDDVTTPAAATEAGDDDAGAAARGQNPAAGIDVADAGATATATAAMAAGSVVALKLTTDEDEEETADAHNEAEFVVTDFTPQVPEVEYVAVTDELDTVEEELTPVKDADADVMEDEEEEEIHIDAPAAAVAVSTNGGVEVDEAEAAAAAGAVAPVDSQQEERAEDIGGGSHDGSEVAEERASGGVGDEMYEAGAEVGLGGGVRPTEPERASGEELTLDGKLTAFEEEQVTGS